jgi:hypothetical protein
VHVRVRSALLPRRALHDDGVIPKCVRQAYVAAAPCVVIVAAWRDDHGDRSRSKVRLVHDESLLVRLRSQRRSRPVTTGGVECRYLSIIVVLAAAFVRLALAGEFRVAGYRGGNAQLVSVCARFQPEFIGVNGPLFAAIRCFDLSISSLSERRTRRADVNDGGRWLLAVLLVVRLQDFAQRTLATLSLIVILTVCSGCR